MNQPQDNPDVSSIDLGRIIPTGALVLVVVFGGYTYLSSSWKTQDAKDALAEQQNQNVELQKEMANMQQMLEDIKTAKVYDEQEKSVSAANALGIIEQGDLVADQISRLGSELAALTERISALESNELGRQVAASPQLLKQYAALKQISLPGSAHADNAKRRLDQLLSAPRSALEQKVAGYTPSPTLVQSLESIGVETTKAISLVQQYQLDLDALSKQAASAENFSAQTLGEALVGIDAEEQARRRELIAASVEKAKQESAELLAAQEAENRRKIAAAEAEAAKMIGEETAAKIRADAAAIKAEIDAAKTERDAAQAKAKLVREYEQDKPLIKQYLQAFTSDGRELRARGSGPASLSFLSGKGALAQSNSGLEELLSLGSYYNDRPRGALPEFFYFNSVNVTGKNDKIAAIEKAQDLLIKYGELMVEYDELAP